MKVKPELYNNTVCPVCKKTVKETRTWAHCKKENGNVCMEHCYKECIHMDRDKCRYLREKTGKKN